MTKNADPRRATRSPVNRDDKGQPPEPRGAPATFAYSKVEQPVVRAIAAEVAAEALKHQKQQKLIVRCRLVLFVALSCLAPAVALGPPANTAASDNLLIRAQSWTSQRIQELPPPVRDALAGVGMFAAVLLPPLPVPLPARIALGVVAGAAVVQHLHASGGASGVGRPFVSFRAAAVEAADASVLQPDKAAEAIAAQVEAKALVVHQLSQIREWAKDWTTEVASATVRSTPSLMLLGDRAVDIVVDALRDELVASPGGTSWLGRREGVLDLDTRRCPASDCTEQIETFMVQRTKAGKPGLILLRQVDGFAACTEPEGSRQRCVGNSESWSDVMGGLEKFVEPIVGGMISIAATGCPPLGCDIKANSFALVLSASPLETTACREMYERALSDGSWLVQQLRRLRATMWDPSRMDSDRGATVPAIANRIGRTLGLVCAAA